MRLHGLAIASNVAVALFLGCAAGGARSAAPGLDGAQLASADSASDYVFQRCPLPGGSVGYPLVVSVAPGSNNAGVDSSWLDEWAHTAALRWPVPSHRRAEMPEYRTLTARVLPDAPRWADDWYPSARHRAEAEVMVRRKGAPTFTLVRGSGDGVFDRTLPGIIDDPLPASPELPPLTGRGADSVRLRVDFGFVPRDASLMGIARFARQQRPARVVPNTLQVYGGPNDRAVVAYMVDVDGQVDPGSITVLSASSPSVGDEVRAGLVRARFTPAEGDCMPIPLTVIQRYGR